MDRRAEHEIQHGRHLAEGDPEVTWGWGTPAGQERAERRAALIARAAGLAPGVLALELGCGTGLFTEKFARSGAQILAVDISEPLLERAAARGLPAPQVRFLAKRFEECEVEGPFDAVIGSSVLHHLDLIPSLQKIRALLKPGGRLSFAEPNLLNPQVFAERRCRRLFPYVSPDETAFVRWSLRKTLAAAGFEAIRIIPFDWMHPAVPARLMGVVRQAGRLLEATPGLREFSGSLCISARVEGRGTRGGQ